jgi:hypothetical protein
LSRRIASIRRTPQPSCTFPVIVPNAPSVLIHQAQIVLRRNKPVVGSSPNPPRCLTIILRGAALAVEIPHAYVELRFRVALLRPRAHFLQRHTVGTRSLTIRWRGKEKDTQAAGKDFHVIPFNEKVDRTNKPVIPVSSV